MESHILQKLIIVLVGLLVSCSPPPSEPLPFDTGILQHGDLICRYGNGFFSKYFRMVSDSVSDFSHVGFVHISGDSIHVIHSEASELTFIGFVRRDPLQDFVKGVRSWGIYRLDRSDSVKTKMMDIAYAYHLKKVPFDMDFSLEDDTKIYCTELIATCINKAVGAELVKPNTVIMGKRGYSVDDTFLVNGIFEVAKSASSN